MKKNLHIDVETYSEADLPKVGAYKYFEHPSTEVLMVAFAFDDEPVEIVDRAAGERLPQHFVEALTDLEVTKWAHNANFERSAFRMLGFGIPVEQWRCSAVKAAYCGLPLSLADVSKALKLKGDGKDSTGKALIRFFSKPRKPSKNNPSTRNTHLDHPEKWQQFKDYCVQDVYAERNVSRILSKYRMPSLEQTFWCLDQHIVDRGVKVDLVMAVSAQKLYRRYQKDVLRQIKDITGIENPNSPAQLKDWLSVALTKEITSLAKQEVRDLIKTLEPGPVRTVLELRLMSSKSSVKKYATMQKYACEDSRARGLLQFYGANRTGRWAGRGVQLQNLPRNYINGLSQVREMARNQEYDTLRLLFSNLADTLSQLIRTAFVAPEGKTFLVADFSAIEARVLAWLAGEKWRLDVFNSHGKIYEASASMMFGIPIEDITKGSHWRDKGKVAELALGYQGAVGALSQMGAARMGISEAEMQDIVQRWRKKSPRIESFWRELEEAAVQAVALQKRIRIRSNIVFDCDGDFMTITLPSGRSLYYHSPRLIKNPWGRNAVQYKGSQAGDSGWTYLDTYGGKLAENITQAVARDVLAISMLRADTEGFQIVMHVHDEMVCEAPLVNAEQQLQTLCDIMAQPIEWAKGLPLSADGYVTPFYKKD